MDTSAEYQIRNRWVVSVWMSVSMYVHLCVWVCVHPCTRVMYFHREAIHLQCLCYTLIDVTTFTQFPILRLFREPPYNVCSYAVPLYILRPYSQLCRAALQGAEIKCHDLRRLCTIILYHLSILVLFVHTAVKGCRSPWYFSRHPLPCSHSQDSGSHWHCSWSHRDKKEHFTGLPHQRFTSKGTIQ